MMLVETGEIVSAIRRSMETHVLPALPEGFARLQVVAALVALDEVADRLANGDPVARANERLEQDLGALAAELPDSSPVRGALEEILAGLEGVGEPRDRNRALGEALTALLRVDDAETARVRKVLEVESGRAAMENAPWMCPEAIESLQ